jgi:hypothetical protein
MAGDWPLDRKSGATGFLSIVEPLQHRKQPTNGIAIPDLEDSTAVAVADKVTAIRPIIPSA